MELENHLRSLASYNLWANGVVIKWLSGFNELHLSKIVSSSFPSIKATLLHIWNAEKFWLSFLTKKPLESFLNDYKGAYELLFNDLLKNSESLAVFMSNLPGEQFNEIIKVNTSWLKGEAPYSVFVQHVFNHSSYHRGQLITMGRLLGYTNPPNTDFSIYFIKHRGD